MFVFAIVSILLGLFIFTYLTWRDHKEDQLFNAIGFKLAKGVMAKHLQVKVRPAVSPDVVDNIYFEVKDLDLFLQQSDELRVKFVKRAVTEQTWSIYSTHFVI